MTQPTATQSTAANFVTTAAPESSPDAWVQNSVEAGNRRNSNEYSGEHTQPIRTLQLGTGWFPEKPGGLARVFYDLFTYLDSAKLPSRGLVTGTKELVSHESQGRVTAFAKSDAPLVVRWLRVRRAFRELLDREPVDLIASHFSLYTFPLLPLLKGPVVVHFHGPWALESEAEQASKVSVWLKKRLERAVYRRGTRFIVLSQAFKTILHETYNVPETHIHIVPGGIDAAAYDTGLSKEAAREKLGWSQERPILLVVRRLVRRQGLENLISAMPEVLTDHPDALLLIAGQGELRGELEAQIGKLGLTNSVQLLGYVPDELLSTTYRGADFSVVPTVAYEGFGLITIESLASGTPVLVTPIGGLPEVVQGLSEELILADSSVAALTEGITSVLSGKRPLPDSKTCQQYVKTHYDHAQIIQQVRRVYELALASG